MSVYFPQVVFPTPPPQTTLDVTLTVQGGPPSGSLALLMNPSWQLQAIFTADTRIQKFPFGALQGEFFLVGQKYAEPKAAAARLVTLAGEDQSFYLDIDEGQRPRPGHGYLAGDHPEGITRVEGEPAPATIRVHYRAESGSPGDGVLVAEVQSNEDGTWLVQNLDPDLKFDVICRFPGYNDMILSNVSPVLAAGLQFEGSFAILESTVEILLGTGPYQVDVVDGALPPGVEIQVAGDVMSLVGKPEEWGQFSFVVRVIDSAGISGVFASELETFQTDPHWDKVVSLLHFDGNLNDEAGGEWAGEGHEFEDSGTPLGLMLKTNLGYYVESQFDISLKDSEPYTLEFFLKKQSTHTTATPVSLYQSNNNRLGVYFNDQIRIRAWYNSNVITVPVDMYELHHYALVGMGNGQIRLYVDGIWDGQVIGRAHNVTGKLVMGNNGNGAEPYGGLIGELRITKGVARYTEDFTPPTAPFPNRGP